MIFFVTVYCSVVKLSILRQCGILLSFFYMIIFGECGILLSRALHDYTRLWYSAAEIPSGFPTQQLPRPQFTPSIPSPGNWQAAAAESDPENLGLFAWE